jgi:hypothetical protein
MIHAISSMKNLIQIQQSVQKLHPPKMFKRPPFWNGCSYGIEEYEAEVIFNVITSLQNFFEINQ